MIGIVIREISFLKVLTPIARELHNSGAKYILYYMNKLLPGKGYATPTKDRLVSLVPELIHNSHKAVPFNSEKQLLNSLVQDKISKFVSLEVWLCFRSILKDLKKNNIKLYNIQYLTDSILQPSAAITAMDRVYYTSEHIMKMQQKFSGTKFDPKRDRCLGTPLFSSVRKNNGSGDILVLTPNIRVEHVGSTFGSKDNLIKIFSKLAAGGDLIFKTRKKQWLPQELKKYAKTIVDDSKQIYPPATVELFEKCYMTVLFCSTGVYEAVLANNRVLNIELNSLSFLGWKEPKKSIFYEPHNFDGVTETIKQHTILGDDWKFEPKKIDQDKRKIWINKYIGKTIANSDKLIAEDILLHVL